MTEGQRKMVRELATLPLRMRLSNRERAEVDRVAEMEETAVLGVELAAWVERVFARAKRVSGRAGR